ncbi:MAG: Ig-like domain repeat protein [Acidobacteriaceae bacterium]|nr:Ig-like domain repeat protein [Acidobacteriaceae bacterium]
MSLFTVAPRAMRRLCAAVFVLFAASSLASAQSTSSTVVISQVFGGGGGTGTASNYLYSQDYVELFNMSGTTQSIGGWSVQYMSTGQTATTATNVVAIPSGVTLAPGQYYLIAGPTGSSTATYTGAALPVAADVTAAVGSFSMAGAGGKVFLVNNTTALTITLNGTACVNSAIIDYVGSSAANCYQGTGAAPTIAATSASVRTVTCTNTGNNSTDFSTSTSAVPHDLASTTAPCAGTAVAPTLTSATATPSSIVAGNPVAFSVAIAPGTGALTTETVDLSSIGGSATQALTASGTGTYSYTYSIPTTVATGSYTITFKATDSNSLSSTATASLSVQDATTPPEITSGTISASTSSATLGTSVVFTAVFGGNVGTPTGTVTFTDGSNTLGAGTSTGNGTWTYTTTTLALGSHSVTATYNGDTTYTTPYTTATPAPVTIVPVPVADFTLILSNTSLTASAEQKTQLMTVGIQAVNGFSETVALTCSGLPSGSRCSFSPASLTGSGTSTVTIAVDNAALHHNSSPFGKHGGETALAFGLLALPLAFRRRMRSRIGTLAIVLAFGLTLAGITGCGNDGTPVGSSTVTVTAKSTSYTKTATFTLKVQ